MTQKSAKKKGKKSTKAGAQPGVLGSLRSTRPTRIGGERRASARARTSATTALAEQARAKAEPTKAAKAPQVEEAKAKAKAAKAAKPKPAKPAQAETHEAPEVRPVKRVVPKTGARSKPAPERVLPPEPDGRLSGPPRGTEIVTTAVQAAGELAQIGVTVGGQLLRRAARRIPRP